MSFLSHYAAIADTVPRQAMTFLRVLWFVFLLGAPRLALAAGSVSLGALVQWVDKSGRVLARDVNNQKTATLGDCNSDNALQFPITFSADFSNATSSAQVWVGGSGADCTTVAARAGTTQTCWRATSANLIKPADSPTMSVTVRIQDIMSQDKTKQDAYVNASAATACQPVPQTTLTVYFMTFDNGGVVGTVGASYSVTIDTEGPTPPTNLKADVGNARLYLSFTPPVITGQNVAFTDVYCAVSTTAGAGGGTTTTTGKDASTAAAADAGASDASLMVSVDSGALDASSASSNDESLSTLDVGAQESSTTTQDASTDTTSSRSALNCALSSAIVSGATVPATLPEGVWLCARETASSALVPSSVTVTKGPDGKPLENGVNYTMAVAFVDTVGNAGVLSERTCATPEVTRGFYDQYVSAGGAASGCALSHGGSRSLAGVILLGLVLAAVRRSR